MDFVILGVLLLISILYYKANVFYIYLVVYIWFGAAYGMMLQYGRFCFASASRDLFAAGVPRTEGRLSREGPRKAGCFSVAVTIQNASLQRGIGQLQKNVLIAV